MIVKKITASLGLSGYPIDFAESNRRGSSYLAITVRLYYQLLLTAVLLPTWPAHES